MMMTTAFTAPYTVTPSREGNYFVFYCELTGKPVYTAGPIEGSDPSSCFEMAAEEARPYFNRCSRCGKWVSDFSYNMDEMRCAACAPYQRLPRYCTQCGAPIPTGNQYCVRCGRKL